MAWQADNGSATVNISTIGADLSRDYQTIGDWIAATSYDLVGAGTIEIGLMYADAILAATVTFNDAAGKGINNFRWLMPAPGEGFIPSLGTGVIIESGASFGGAVNVDEIGVRVTGPIGVRNTGAAGQNRAIRSESVNGSNNLFAQIFATSPNAGTNTTLIQISAIDTLVISCISRGTGGAATGPIRGFDTASGIGNVDYFNCIADLINRDAGATGTGISTQFAAAGCRMSNCVATRSAGSDFIPNAGHVGASLVSSDATAFGSDPFINQLVADLFVDADNSDYRTPLDSPIWTSGADLSGDIDGGVEFNYAFAQETLHGILNTPFWNRGAYDGPIQPQSQSIGLGRGVSNSAMMHNMRKVDPDMRSYFKGASRGRGRGRGGRRRR